MFGCLGRLVSAAILLVAGAALWHYRAEWLPTVKAYFQEKASEVEVELPKIGALPAGVTFASRGQA